MLQSAAVDVQPNRTAVTNQLLNGRYVPSLPAQADPLAKDSGYGSLPILFEEDL